MNDFTLSLLIFHAWLCGIAIGYIIWAPETRFKRAFCDGLILKFVWGRFVK